MPPRSPAPSTAAAQNAAARPQTKTRRRVTPSQDRGQKRYEGLLDAAEKVIAEVGVDAATTNAIAARARSGMGSLYRFFPNKEAIVSALADRYTNSMRPLTLYSRRPELKDVPLAVMVDMIVDPLVDFFRRAPAYRHVFCATDEPGTPDMYECGLASGVVDNVEAIMKARVPGTDPKLRRVHATVAVELVHHMLGFAFQSPPARRRALVDETKRLLALYSEMIERGDDPLRRLR